MTTWKKTTIATAIATAIGPWAAHGQTLEVTQGGEGNLLETNQSRVTGASIRIEQTGVGARISVGQSDGASGAGAVVRQDSTGGSVTIEQSGAAHSANVTQTADGEGGSARIAQRSAGDPTAASQAEIRQQGTAASTAEVQQDRARGAMATLEQRGTRSGLAAISQFSGSGSQAVVRQIDSAGSETRIQQFMSGTRAEILQVRSNASVASVSQSQASDRAQIQQIGNDSVQATVDQMTTASRAEVSQQGNASTRASIRQVYSTDLARVFQRTNLDTVGTVHQEFANTGSTVAIGQADNRSTRASATQSRGVASSAINISQNGNLRVGATASQQGFGNGGYAPRTTASQIQIEQTGNQDSDAQVMQTAGTHQASLVQIGNAGVRATMQQFATSGERTARIEQTRNSAANGMTALTQQGGTNTRADVIQASNTVGTLQAGVLQTTSGDAGSVPWTSGTFVADHFLPPPSAGSYLGDNVGNRAEITQTGNTGASVAAGIAMMGVTQGIGSVTQADNGGIALGLIRMVGVRDAVARITQQGNAAGTRSVAEIEQAAHNGAGHGSQITLEQRANTAGEVWMKAVQSGTDGAMASGSQTGSASVHAYLRQEAGSTGSTATLEQRSVGAAQAVIRQGTADGVMDAGGPGSAAMLPGLLNVDPGPGRGAALASVATLMQSDGFQLSAGIVQTGAGLRAQIMQSGASKEASIIQNGTGHVASIAQAGATVGAQAAAVEIRQYGPLPQSATITQNAAGGRITVLQQ